jgi:hypothetical protein
MHAHVTVPRLGLSDRFKGILGGIEMSIEVSKPRYLACNHFICQEDIVDIDWPA